MKAKVILTVVLIGCFVFAVNGFCEHYVNGTEGVKCGSPPPPGFYDKIYTAYYSASQFNDNNGDEIPVDADISVFAHVHRLVYISKDTKVMGGHLGAEFIVPIQKVSLDIGGQDDDQFGIGDIVAGPILTWYSQKWEAVSALDIYFPTGDDEEMAALGKGYYTLMPTLGGTYYFDPNKQYSGSILARYEIHTEHDDTEITAGNDFHFEFGVGYSPKQFMDIGIGGYYQMQVTEDSGTGASDDKDSVMAVGPQISQLFPQKKWGYSFSVFKEFGAKGDAMARPEGYIACLSITWMIF